MCIQKNSMGRQFQKQARGNWQLSPRVASRRQSSYAGWTWQRLSSSRRRPWDLFRCAGSNSPAIAPLRFSPCLRPTRGRDRSPAVAHRVATCTRRGVAALGNAVTGALWAAVLGHRPLLGRPALWEASGVVAVVSPSPPEPATPTSAPPCESEPGA